VVTICDVVVKMYLILIDVYWDIMINYNKNGDESFLSK
jgi:hypothetical protein